MATVGQFLDGFAQRRSDGVYAQLIAENDDGSYMARIVTSGATVRATPSRAGERFTLKSWVWLGVPSASRTVIGSPYLIISGPPAQHRGLSQTTPDTQADKSVSPAAVLSVDPMPLEIAQGGAAGEQEIRGFGLFSAADYIAPGVTNGAAPTITPALVTMRPHAAADAEEGLHDLIIGGIRVKDVLRVTAGSPPPPLIYGLAYGGGAFNSGVLFAFDPTAATLTVIRSLDSASDAVYNPSGKIAAVDGVLYFACLSDLGDGYGGIMKWDIAAGLLTLVYAFDGATGNLPIGGLTAVGSFVYGSTLFGGANGHGVLFKIDTATDTFMLLHSFDGDVDGFQPVSMTYADGVLYGVTSGPGGGASALAAGNGSIFRVDPDTDVVELLYAYPRDPTGTIAISAFNVESANSDGAGHLYVVCQSGFGPADDLGHGDNVGQIDLFDLASSTMTLAVAQFLNTSPYGQRPIGVMMLAETGVFYGGAGSGGSGGSGTIFAFNPALNSLDTYAAFDGTNGAYPGRGGGKAVGSLIYIATTAGGAGDNGTIGVIDTSGNPYAMLLELASDGSEGSYADTGLETG